MATSLVKLAVSLRSVRPWLLEGEQHGARSLTCQIRCWLTMCDEMYDELRTGRFSLNPPAVVWRLSGGYDIDAAVQHVSDSSNGSCVFPEKRAAPSQSDGSTRHGPTGVKPQHRVKRQGGCGPVSSGNVPLSAPGTPSPVSQTSGEQDLKWRQGRHGPDI